MKILVIKRDKIGDLLLSTPLLAHLKNAKPDAEVHVLANDYNAWVVRDNPHVDRIWVYRRVRSGKRVSLAAALGSVRQLVQLRREQFDVAIVANGTESPRAIRRGLASRSARIIAYVNDPARWPRVTHPLTPDPAQHEIDALLAMLAPLGVKAAELPAHPQYRLPDAAQHFAETWLAERRLQPRRYVVLGLGARRAKKQPTPAQILRWSTHWRSAYDLDTVFMWTPGGGDNPLYPGDDEVAQATLDAHAAHIHPFRGPLQPALGLIWNARTSVFPDSGLMHFAAASPGGVLGLFAETDVSPHPRNWGPRGRGSAYLEAVKSVAELSDELVLSRIEQLAQLRPAAGRTPA